MRKVLVPKSKEITHAVHDNYDNLLTDPISIRNEYKTEFQHRLTKKDIRSNTEWFEKFINGFCKLHVKTTTEIQNPDVTFSAFLEAKEFSSKLKTGKSTQPTGFIREVHKHAGDDFLLSLRW